MNDKLQKPTAPHSPIPKAPSNATPWESRKYPAAPVEDWLAPPPPPYMCPIPKKDKEIPMC